jgi:uncharacterized glyoxalase superfamily protein PhnB
MSEPSVSVVPGLRYRDAATAVDFLCRAFGFDRHLVVPGESGGVVHAQLRHGNGLVMLGDAGDAEFDQWVKPPAAIGGVGNQSVYVIVDDVDAHCEKARAAGAEILMEPHDPDYGGRLYSCRDPEGHVWSFGSYDPLAEG